MKTQRFLDNALDSIKGLDSGEYDYARDALISLYDNMNECIDDLESDNYDKGKTIDELKEELSDAERTIEQLQDDIRSLERDN